MVFIRETEVELREYGRTKERRNLRMVETSWFFSLNGQSSMKMYCICLILINVCIISVVHEEDTVSNKIHRYTQKLERECVEPWTITYIERRERIQNLRQITLFLSLRRDRIKVANKMYNEETEMRMANGISRDLNLYLLYIVHTKKYTYTALISLDKAWYNTHTNISEWVYFPSRTYNILNEH